MSCGVVTESELLQVPEALTRRRYFTTLEYCLNLPRTLCTTTNIAASNFIAAWRTVPLRRIGQRTPQVLGQPSLPGAWGRLNLLG